jgi:hypothetical protein
MNTADVLLRNSLAVENTVSKKALFFAFFNGEIWPEIFVECLYINLISTRKFCVLKMFIMSFYLFN